MKKLMIASACFTLAACGDSSDSNLKVDGQLNTNTPSSNIELARAGGDLQDTTSTLTDLISGEDQNQESMTSYDLQDRAVMPCEYGGSLMTSGSEISSSVAFSSCIVDFSTTIDGGLNYTVQSMNESTGSYSIRVDYNDLQVTEGSAVTTIDGDITTAMSITETSMKSTLSGSSLAIESPTDDMLIQQFNYTFSVIFGSSSSFDMSYYIATDAGTFYVYSDGAIVNGEGRVIIEGTNAQYIVVYSGGAIDESASGLDLEKDGEIDNASSEDEAVASEEAA